MKLLKRNEVEYKTTLIMFFFISICMQIALSADSERPLVVVVPSYNNERWCEDNLDSIFNQEYKNYRVIYIDDCSTDGTFERVSEYVAARGVHDKITFIKNKKNKGIFANHYCAVHMCDDHEIILNVDGDDRLIDNQVFKKVNEAYSNPQVWMTYGQFISWPEGKQGFCKRSPKQVVKQNAYREYTWRASHMRTFYAWLFKRINLKDCMYEGLPYRVCADMVMMYPMLEMARDVHLHVMDDVLYVYNETGSKDVHSKKYMQQLRCSRAIRNARRYEALSPDAPQKRSEDIRSVDCILYSDNIPHLLQRSLDSIADHVKNVGAIHVIYCADTAQAQETYDAIIENYSDLYFYHQTKKHSCKELLCEVLSGASRYILLATDGTLFTHSFDVARAAHWVAYTDAFGLYCTLGTDVVHNSTLTRMQKQPPLTYLDEGVCAWQFEYAEYAWRTTVQPYGALYRTDDLLKICTEIMEYNSLQELCLSAQSMHIDQGAVGLCYEDAQAKNIFF